MATKSTPSDIEIAGVTRSGSGLTVLATNRP